MSIFKNKGQRNFERCAHKDVTIRPRYYTKANAETNDFLDAIKGGTTHGLASVSAHMECPRVGGDDAIKTDRYNTAHGGASKTQRKALINLGKNAGLLVCGNCPLVDMTPDEVRQQRIADAESEARALIAEANLRHLQQQIADGEDIVADLPPLGGIYTPPELEA